MQTIDAERYLTVNDYDAFGNLKTVTRVDAKVQGTIAAGQGVILAAAAPNSGSYVLINIALDHATGRVYDRNNRLLKETDAENYTEGTEALDAFGQRLTVKNKLGATVTYSYDRLGRVLTETLPVQAKDGAGTQRDVVNEYQYDSRGNRIVSIEAKGLVEQRTTQMRYDGANRLTMRIGMSYTAFAADTGATPSVVTPADAWRYDARGNLVETITHGQLAANGQTVTGSNHSLASYDALNRKTLEIGPDRGVTRYSYDIAGNEVWQTRYGTPIADGVALNAGAALPEPQTNSAIDRTLRTTYDALNRKISVSVDSLQTWDSNSASMVISNLQPQPVVLQRFFYDALGNVTERVDGRGNSTRDYFDGLDRRVMSVDAAGSAVVWSYERAGSVATKETRYGQLLSMAAARQADKLSGLNAANDPANLANVLANQPAQPGAEANRVTVLTLDRLDRVTEKRVKDVAYDYVDIQGKRSSGTADAVTTYTYNGLGAVTQIRELATATGGAQGPQVWEQTDIQYDNLDRETLRIAPGFKDYLGNPVNPRTQQIYDGLGRVVQSIRRGTDDNVDTDDQITRYKFDNSGLASTTDAENAVTAYTYDAEGNLSRRTFVAVKRADGTRRDLVTTYQYDAVGRQTAMLDVGTQELRRTRYNAFGEVTARGLGNGWEEFAEYNALGKVTKTDSGDGAIKFYVYDAAGNVTREIRGNGDSTVDLISMTLKQAAESTKMYSRISVYNSRNLLVKTMDPQIEMLRDTDALGKLYTEKYEAAWTPSAVTTRDSEELHSVTVAVPDSTKNQIQFSFAGAGLITFSVILGGLNTWGYAGAGQSLPQSKLGTGIFSFDVSACKGKGRIAFVCSTTDGTNTPDYVSNSGRSAVTEGYFEVDANGKVSYSAPASTQLTRPYIKWPVNPLLAGTAGQEALDYDIYSSTGAFLPTGRVWGDGVTGPVMDMWNYRGSTIRIDYTRGLGHEKASLRVTVDSQGHITTSQTAVALANKVNIYVQGRDIKKALLNLGGITYSADGVYATPTATSFGYTRFTFDVASNYPGGGTFDFTMQALDQYGAIQNDEFGAAIVQQGRVVLSGAGGDPVVLNKVSALKISSQEIITKLQDFNAFGEVVEERDDRVKERMLASINAERKRQGVTPLADISNLSNEQADGARTTLKYNALGLLVAKIDPETWITEANGYRYRARPVTAYGYDLLGRHTTTLDANGQLSRTSQLAGSRGEEGAGAFDFDAMGGAADVFNADKGGTVQRRFDVFGKQPRHQPLCRCAARHQPH